MRNLIAVAVVLFVALGCGGPHCDNSAMEAVSVSACSSGGSPPGYCQCVMDHLYARYSCGDISNGAPPVSALVEACAACAPQYGASASDCR